MEPVKESIFASAIRALCKAFAVIIGIFIAFIPIFVIIGLLGKDDKIIEKTTVHYLPDLDGNNEMVSSSAPVVLRINIHGVIGDGITADDVNTQLIDSRKGTLKDNRVKAVLVHLKTPGGSALDSDTIYRLLTAYKEQYKVPIFAYIDGLCASGGMYVCSAVNRIYSGPVSIIGSIGVLIGPFFNFYDALGRIGVKTQTLTEGKDKDMMNPFREWQPDEDENLKSIGSYLYGTFVDIFTHARTRVNKQRLLHDYGAHVFDPPTAEKIGYIDVANVSYNDALFELLHAAHIDEKKPYQVIELKMKKRWLQELFKGESPLLTGKIKHVLQIESNDSFSYLYKPGNTNPILYK